MKVAIKCTRLPQIEKDIKQLQKKYHTVEVDICYAERLLEGETILKYAPVSGFNDHSVFKMRVINTGLGKGKSDGYRLIFERKEYEMFFARSKAKF